MIGSHRRSNSSVGLVTPNDQHASAFLRFLHYSVIELESSWTQPRLPSTSAQNVRPPRASWSGSSWEEGLWSPTEPRGLFGSWTPRCPGCSCTWKLQFAGKRSRSSAHSSPPGDERQCRSSKKNRQWRGTQFNLRLQCMTACLSWPHVTKDCMFRI